MLYYFALQSGVFLSVHVRLNTSPSDFSDLVLVDPLPGVCLQRTNRRHCFIHQQNTPISDCSCLLPELTTDVSQISSKQHQNQ